MPKHPQEKPDALLRLVFEGLLGEFTVADIKDALDYVAARYQPPKPIIWPSNLPSIAVGDRLTLDDGTEAVIVPWSGEHTK